MNKILTPYKINNTTIKNRTVFAPVATVSCSKDGIISDKLLNYYDERAKDSTIGLSIVKHSYVHQLGRSKFGQISIIKE
jgi:2,4-dienoyl-CoA reductase-like NADH-dependent reductase (Old Yellow Enzyme family)